MSEERDQPVALWQRMGYTVYLRLAAIVASTLTLIAGVIALNTARNYSPAAEEDNDQLSESGELWSDGAAADIVRETLAVTGTLTALAAATLLLQTALVLATKCSSYVYEPSTGTLFKLKLMDFMSSFLLVAALAASTTAEGVVAHGWAQGNDDSSRDSVFKAVAGSTAFGFLSVVVLLALCIVTFCTIHSLQRSLNNRQKIASSITTV